MKKLFFLPLLLFFVVTAKAQDAEQLERQADEWASKSFMQSKALSGYLACYRSATDTETKKRMLKKSSLVLSSKKLFLPKDAATADSLINESRGQFGEDTANYLPLIEYRIINSGNASGKYRQEYELIGEAYRIRENSNFHQGERYELLLRKHVNMFLYKRELSAADKQQIFDKLWIVYQDNHKTNDTLDYKLVDSYAQQCSSNGNTEKAVELLEIKRDYLKNHQEVENKEYIETLGKLSDYYDKIYDKTHGFHDYVLTEEKKKECIYRKEVIELKSRTGAEIYSFEISRVTSLLMDFYHDTIEAHRLAALYTDQAAQRHGKESKDYCDALKQLADATSGRERATYRIEMLETQKKIGVEWSENNVKDVVEDLKKNQQDTSKAIRIAEEYAQMAMEQHGKESEAYCNSLGVVAEAYGDQDARSIAVLEELLDLEEKIHGKGSVYYNAVKMRLFSVNDKIHRQESAIAALSGQGEDENTTTLTLLATHQVQYGQYREAISTYNKILEQYVSGTMTSMPSMSEYMTPELKAQMSAMNFMTAVMGTVNCYEKLKDMKGMLAFGEKWERDQRLDEDERHLVFTNVAGMAGLYGRSSDAVINYIDNYIIDNASASVLRMAEMKALRTNALLGMERYDDAMRTMDALVENLRQKGIGGRMLLRYKIYQEICAMAIASSHPDKSEYMAEAKRLNKEALASMKQLKDYKTLAEYLSLCCRAVIYEDMEDNFDEVLRICKEIDAFDYTKVTMLDSSSFFSASVLAFSSSNMQSSSVENQRYRALCRKSMKREAEMAMKENIKEKMNLLHFSLSQMDHTMQQNTLTWTTQVNDELCNVIELTGSDSLIMMLYDYTLLYKQSYLTATNQMRNQILNSDNTTVRGKFEELQQLRRQSQQLQSAGLPVQKVNERIVQLEKQLVEDSKMFGDFTRGLKLNWHDIQEKLKPNEAVIEFVSYTSYVNQGKKLGALVLRKGWSYPKFLLLTEEKKPTMDIYNNTTFSTKCWGKVESSLKGVNTLYFAPAGQLYTVNIESLPHPSGKGFMSDHYTLFRISSSRELMNGIKYGDGNRHALLYGGLAYDTEIKRPDESGMKRAASSRYQYLPGTMQEVYTINNFLKSGEIQTQILTGASGSESSFKSLSTNNVDIIHVATHGFYEIPRNGMLSRFFVSIESEDRILTRSGLLFAGANNTLFADDNSEGADDGILTSLEISTLDLRKVDLLILSACETGMGDITGDGVFGLQRGFKMAGVNSILMSLWKVDDDATCLLMTEFYKNWISKKMTKHDALEEAKKTVRSHKEKGWDDPKYWAAFILLDALD